MFYALSCPVDLCRPRPKDPAGKHAPQYEVITVVRPVSLCKKPALAVSIGDLNGLYDVPEVHQRRSFFAMPSDRC